MQDEHVEKIDLADEPDLVVIEAYITSANRAYRYADHYRRKGAHVCIGGLHPTSLPEEAARHADSVFCGPGEDTWPAFLEDFKAGRPKPLYRSTVRTLAGMPRPRRDLIKRERYLVPNSLVVSRGCPHSCDFCYKDTFFRGGRSFYVQAVDDALAEIEGLPGRHLYFLDDNLLGSPPFAEALFDGMRGMGRVWQSAATVRGVMRPGLLEKAVESGLRSLFIGFETLDPANLAAQHKLQNLGGGYEAAIRRLHDLGVMVNASFVFGMDDDEPGRVRAHRGVGGGAGDRDLHVPHPDAVPGHAAGAAPERRGPRDERRLGLVRHTARGLPPRAHDRRAAGVGLLGRVPRLLQLELHLEGRGRTR